jgi:hypothetical protein
VGGPESGKAQVSSSTKKALVNKKGPSAKSTGNADQANVSNPARDNRRSFPNLPFNKTRMLESKLQTSSRRKKGKSGGELRSDVDGDNSDSIQCPDSDTPVTLEAHEDGSGEFEIEIVLPHLSGQANEVPPDTEQSIPGTDPTLLPVVEEARRRVDATKLLNIAEEVGLKFHGEIGEDRARMLDMEDRDFEEKEGWEMRRGNTSVQ